MPLRLKHNTNLKSDRNMAHITCTPVVDTLSTLNSISSATESNDPWEPLLELKFSEEAFCSTENISQQ